MSMTQLERTLIARARSAQARKARYLQQTRAGQQTDDQRDQFLMQYGALSLLLSLAHQKGSGLSLEAVQGLCEIEAAERTPTVQLEADRKEIDPPTWGINAAK